MTFSIRVLSLSIVLLVGCSKPQSSEQVSPETPSPQQANKVPMETPANPPLTPVQQIARAIIAGDLPLVKRLLAEHPELLHFKSQYMGTWLCIAAIHDQKQIAEWLLEQGLDINYATEDCQPPLTNAIICLSETPKAFELIHFLLSRGADPNIGRMSISALNCKHPELRLPLLKALVEHGLDVNQVFDVFGDKDNLFTALDWANDECAEYLRSVGAKTAKELKAAASVPEKTEGPDNQKSVAQQVVDYFNREVGPVHVKSLMEIIPEGQTPITVHVIPAAQDRPFITLFTTGLSSRKMNVPPVEDDEVAAYLKNYGFAELYIQLPAGWKYEDLEDPNLNWPIMQLRRLGKHPHANDTWLGAPATVMSRDPVEPLAPNTTFDSLLLLPDKKFQNKAGNTVQLYRLVPLYPEERELEHKSGLPALMRALDTINAPMIVDMSRKNAVVGSRRK